MRALALDTVRQVALRSWRKTLRRPVPLSFSLVQPLLWMLVFGFLFHRYALGPDYATLSYLDFVLPGICCMTVLFGASQSGINLVRDLQTGFVQRMVRASQHPGWLLAGIVGADVVRLLVQAALVAALGVAIGAQLAIDIPGLFVAVIGLALFAYAYASLSCLIALTTKAQESMAVFVHVMNMPLLFTSTALVPSRHMPDWLASAARFNPLSLVADALRDALVLSRTPEVAPLVLPLALLCIVLFVAARAALTRVGNE